MPLVRLALHRRYRQWRLDARALLHGAPALVDRSVLEASGEGGHAGRLAGLAAHMSDIQIVRAYLSRPNDDSQSFYAASAALDRIDALLARLRKQLREAKRGPMWKGPLDKAWAAALPARKARYADAVKALGRVPRRETKS
jgi:hypothetical protein